jgi:hypothetical protein
VSVAFAGSAACDLRNQHKSQGRQEQVRVNDEDVDTILVSNDPGLFALIPVGKRAGGGAGHCLQGQGDYRICAGW